MNKTKIEWCDYSINPVKGLCPMDCKDNEGKSYCYARRMYKRFKWNPEIRYDDWCWQVGIFPPQGSKIFVGSTIELFGPWVKDEWLQTIFDYCDSCHSRTFIFLTKQPQNLAQWSPFPENCYIGCSVTNMTQMVTAIYGLEDVQAKAKFISFEPLLERIIFQGEDIRLLLKGISWMICGQQTPMKASTRPRETWIEEIVRAADKASIPIFLKDNLSDLALLQPLCYKDSELRQELPER